MLFRVNKDLAEEQLDVHAVVNTIALTPPAAKTSEGYGIVAGRVHEHQARKGGDAFGVIHDVDQL